MSKDPMTNETELRQLDAWIAENVFHWVYCGDDIWSPSDSQGVTMDVALSLPYYTTDPAAAMEVLKKCVDKLGDELRELELGRYLTKNDGEKAYYCSHDGTLATSEAPTLELAICLFARQLFQPATERKDE